MTTKATSLTLPAPAKLNLFLHIIGQRADGYHLLQTVFQLLDYGDSISLQLRDDGNIRLHGTMDGIAAEDNLIYRAATALQAASGSHQGADITVIKRLPFGGGLGGGSSDAATTLVGLNHLWHSGLPTTRLARLGLELGADVPVFVHGHSAWAEGVGETLTNITLPEQWYLVIDPGVAVATATVFADKYLTRNTQPITLAAFRNPGGRNDCEAVARRLFPAVDEALVWLSAFGVARLTGTGGCGFVAFTSRSDAESAGAEVPAKWRWFVARGVDQSPLYRVLHQEGK
jgi:4-diphosphocytidyl-2-C-methyl-D-erythritol kinase